MIHKQSTVQEIESFANLKIVCEPIILFGVWHDNSLIAVYGLIKSDRDIPELTLHIFHEQTPIRTWREIKKGLCLLKTLGYANFIAEGRQKFLNKLGILW